MPKTTLSKCSDILSAHLGSLCSLKTLECSNECKNSYANKNNT